MYSYKHGFSGFAAMLTDSQAEELAGVDLTNKRDQMKFHATSYQSINMLIVI